MNEQKKKALKNIGFLVFLFCIFLFTKLVLQPVMVIGPSMEPTFKQPQILLADRTAEKNELQRFDVIIVKHENSYIIKRLIALPNETIQIKDNAIYINDEKIQDVISCETDPGCFESPVTLSENEIVVMGDNRPNSYDSRAFGPTSIDNVMGKILTHK